MGMLSKKARAGMGYTSLASKVRKPKGGVAGTSVAGKAHNGGEVGLGNMQSGGTPTPKVAPATPAESSVSTMVSDKNPLKPITEATVPSKKADDKNPLPKMDAPTTPSNK